MISLELLKQTLTKFQIQQGTWRQILFLRSQDLFNTGETGLGSEGNGVGFPPSRGAMETIFRLWWKGTDSVLHCGAVRKRLVDLGESGRRGGRAHLAEVYSL